MLPFRSWHIWSWRRTMTFWNIREAASEVVPRRFLVGAEKKGGNVVREGWTRRGRGTLMIQGYPYLVRARFLREVQRFPGTSFSPS